METLRLLLVPLLWKAMMMFRKTYTLVDICAEAAAAARAERAIVLNCIVAAK